MVRISALELGPPVGWPIQYRISGPIRRRCAVSHTTCPPLSRESARADDKFRLDRAVRTLQIASTRTRRVCSASAPISVAGDQRGRIWHKGHASTGRHLSDQCCCARKRPRQDFIGHASHAASTVAEWTDCSATPDRYNRLWVDCTIDLAPRPPSNADGPG